MKCLFISLDGGRREHPIRREEEELSKRKVNLKVGEEEGEERKVGLFETGSLLKGIIFNQCVFPQR